MIWYVAFMDDLIEFSPVKPDHFVEIASLQTQLLPHDIFSLLGERRLVKRVYPYLMNFVSVSRVAIVKGKIVGSAFLLRSNFIDANFFFKHSITLMILALKHPKICLSSAQAILRRPSNLPTSELLWVCVHPEHQGQGVGKDLVKDLLLDFLGSKIQPIFVRTLESTPGNIRFYESLGFNVIYRSHGRVWLVHE
jgi:GNAT superfamily N-acetyltransferase